MDGLTEAYTGGGADASVRRRAVGCGLFLAGVSFVTLGVLFGTTDLLSGFGYGLYESRRIAGVLAGGGVPALLLGVVTVLPADRRVRLVAAAGGVLAAIAVGWFWLVYPTHWAGYGLDRTLPVSALYLVGLTVTTVGLFVGVARFKTRNAPGGTVSLSVLRRGETRIVEVERRGRGSVGLLGSVGWEPTTRGDGGTEVSAERRPVDAYCGNCRYLEYTTDEDELRPYCTYHDSEMESMDACESWTGRKQL
ncbi:hypothetical protein HAPAU_00760 [Halalkalicoccus paucihalophilus]|uniref:Uncharacterized protein n=1 Tax=Halalkalicoccus paucihalophilus TaxID=1008153 RepID=A0A151AIS4_9EURY|nr:hypothetical protein [Halalkalicoccus paucihalophilus]KYH27410.1 hypothetical protein HAPAU_00760 [Halalkalicoccus paucihalophilus]